MLILEIIKIVPNFHFVFLIILLILVHNLIHKTLVITLKNKPSAMRNIKDVSRVFWRSHLVVKQLSTLGKVWKLCLLRNNCRHISFKTKESYGEASSLYCQDRLGGAIWEEGSNSYYLILLF